MTHRLLKGKQTTREQYAPNARDTVVVSKKRVMFAPSESGLRQWNLAITRTKGTDKTLLSVG